MTIGTGLVAGLCAVAALGQAAGADVILDWNETLVTAVSDQPPPIQNRIAAIAQLAVFEAVNAVTGRFRPYRGNVAAAPDASAEAAVVAAAHTVLRHYLPNRAGMLDGARASSLAAIPEGPAKRSGIDLGAAAAARTIEARAHDGSEPPAFYLPASSNPGEWQLTPACPPSGGVFLHLQNVRPFAIRSAARFRSDPPPPLTSARYARAYREVLEAGGTGSAERPQDRADVARVYAALSDAVLWNQIASQIATAARASLPEKARMFALLNIALHDAGVALMETKYHYKFWRPETAIRAGGSDRNARTEPDPSFTPFVAAPCFPSYPSGHAATSHAARAVLERVFGGRGYSIVLSTPAAPGVTLRYNSLHEITRDIDDARVYGGIHFRFDQEAGGEQGRRVGIYIYRRYLRPLEGCACEEEEAGLE